MPTRAQFSIFSRMAALARSTMSNPLIVRIRLLTSLSDEALDRLENELTAVQTFPAHADIVPEGQPSDLLRVVLDGWAGRYRLLEDGRRQIPALLLPGDICDLDGLLLRRVHSGVVALSPCTIGLISHARLRSMLDEDSVMRDVFWWLTFVENAISAEWSVGLGRRSAHERLAHLFCELLVRLATVNMTEGNSYALPLTQNELGDALGLSTVHVNRTLQELRASGLVSLEGGNVTIHNWEALKAVAGFEPDYLHVEGLRVAAERTLHH